MLEQDSLAGNAVHDLERTRRIDRSAGRRCEESKELGGFIGTGGNPQRLEREARVAHPAVPIVPVATAADRFRQRRRGRGDDGAGGREGQCLQHAPAEAHEIGVRTLVTLVHRIPRSPTGKGRRQHRRHISLGERRRMRDPRRAESQREAHSVAGLDGEPGLAVPRSMVKGTGRVQRERHFAAQRAQSTRRCGESRRREAVLGARREFDVELHPSRQSFDCSEQDVGSGSADRVAFALAERERVGQRRPSPSRW